MARRSLVLWLALLDVLLASCASVSNAPVRKAGTGDIAFRLHWNTADDIDLHVVDPEGNHLGWSTRRSPSNGQLDIDCNGSPLETCEKPVENVFWPSGAAPEGAYIVWVTLQRPETLKPVAYRLDVLAGRRVVWRTRGKLAARCAFAGPWKVRFARALPVAVREVVPQEITDTLRAIRVAGCPLPGLG